MTTLSEWGRITNGNHFREPSPHQVPGAAPSAEFLAFDHLARAALWAISVRRSGERVAALA